MRAAHAVLAFAMISTALAQPAGAQQRRAVCPGFTPFTRPAYDGRTTFVRIQYGAQLGGRSSFGRRGMSDGWFHDYPTAECHFTRLLTELTSMRVRTDESHILTLDDPELFKHPVAYLSEPGFWYPSENEVVGLRKYLQKGGFIIFDDFEGAHIYNLAEQMNRVIPNVRFIKLEQTHPVFDAFYRVKSIEMVHPGEGTPSTFYGVFEDNDPNKRLLAIANHNNDIGDYWEWSDVGYYGIAQTNEAYKLGINYLIYRMSR